MVLPRPRVGVDEQNLRISLPAWCDPLETWPRRGARPPHDRPRFICGRGSYTIDLGGVQPRVRRVFEPAAHGNTRYVVAECDVSCEMPIHSSKTTTVKDAAELNRALAEGPEVIAR